jgi:hypothetical protein
VGRDRVPQRRAICGPARSGIDHPAAPFRRGSAAGQRGLPSGEIAAPNACQGLSICTRKPGRERRDHRCAMAPCTVPSQTCICARPRMKTMKIPTLAGCTSVMKPLFAADREKGSDVRVEVFRRVK